MKKILVTGSNGFLGGKFVKSYSKEYDITTLSRSNSDYNIDLSKSVELEHKIDTDVVIHCAGKAHMIPKTEEEISAFFGVNVGGTKNLLNCIVNVRFFIFISSVAVYGEENGNEIEELHPLLGTSPYAKSKIEAEKILTKWCEQKGVKLLILRLPLLASPNPPGNLGQMIDAIKRKRYVSINRGCAKRSVVLVDDIVKWLPQFFFKPIEGVYNLTDNEHPNFSDLETLIALQLKTKRPYSIPIYLAKIIGLVGDIFNLNVVNSCKINKMIKDLTFSSKKATINLGWNPKPVSKEFKIF